MIKSVQKLIVGYLKPGTALGVVTFHSKVETIIPMTEITDEIREEIALKLNFPAYGGTRIGEGLQRCQQVVHQSISVAD